MLDRIVDSIRFRFDLVAGKAQAMFMLMLLAESSHLIMSPNFLPCDGIQPNDLIVDLRIYIFAD